MLDIYWESILIPLQFHNYKQIPSSRKKQKFNTDMDGQGSVWVVIKKTKTKQTKTLTY